MVAATDGATTDGATTDGATTDGATTDAGIPINETGAGSLISSKNLYPSCSKYHFTQFFCWIMYSTYFLCLSDDIFFIEDRISDDLLFILKSEKP